jgi:hypothetical protein
MSESELVSSVPADAVAVIEREGLNEQAGKSLLIKFAPYNKQINVALETSKTITDGASAASQKVARTCRLELRRIRCEIENVRKEAKADALRYGKAVDGLANVLKFLCEPEEKRLEDIEKHAERVEAARIAELVADRSVKLAEWEGNPEAYNLALMDDATFDATLETAKRVWKEAQEAIRKAEADRIAKEKADAEERRRMIQENERLKAEAEAREKEAAKERAKAESERKRVEAERAKERAQLESKAKAEAEARERLEAEARQRQAAEAEQAKKEADKKHRAAVMNEAYKDLLEAGVDDMAAKSVIKLVAAGSVRGMRMVW